MTSWSLAPGASPALARAMPDLAHVFALQGELLGRGPQSEVMRVTLGGTRYYVKRYFMASGGLRRFFGRPRVQTEWENLARFAAWGIPTTPLVGWGMEQRGGRFVRGALVTAEIPGAQDLASLVRDNDARLRDRAWVGEISRQLAQATRCLHDHRFGHNDLHWRNVLVDAARTVYLFDCPSGRFWWGPFLQYRIVKDLACIDRIAKRQLSRTQRLRFYLAYAGRTRLLAEDKRRIRRVLVFFKGRRQWNG